MLWPQNTTCIVPDSFICYSWMTMYKENTDDKYLVHQTATCEETDLDD